MASNSVATQRFLGNRMAHTWTLHFLAQDPTDIVRWGATCHIARAETSDENPVLWAYVWTRGLGKTKPLGSRQIRRAKAHVLKAHASAAGKAKKKPWSLSPAYVKFIDTYRRTTDSSAFPHIAINRVNYPGGWVRWSAVGATTLDHHKIALITLQRKIKKKIEIIENIELYEGINDRLMLEESKRLMKKKLKRKPRTKKTKTKKKTTTKTKKTKKTKKTTTTE